MLNTINVEFNDIDKIYHITDVHIRNLKRHAEYREVFSRLYKYISDTKTNGSVIVLTGDIVHAKTDMTPELIEMTQSFLKSLSDICITILIPGNHDANLNNSSRLDALTPIVNSLEHPNLHYLKDSCAMNIGGITFIHTSVFDKSEKIIQADSVDGNYKISLYHGAVDSVKTDTGFSISNSKVNVESFDGYDLALLGDIHVPNQSLNDSGTIKYAGSLIMQNHSESNYPEHGILVWDVATKQSKFVPISNDYGYVTINIKDGKVVGSPKLPKKPRIRLSTTNTKQSEISKIVSELSMGSNIQEISVIKNTDFDSQSIALNAVLKNTNDLAYQNSLIRDFLSDKFALPSETIELIEGINIDTNKSIISKLGSCIKYTTWKLKRFEFSNMFSYGDNNVIDFTNMKGTYGIFAPNAIGKSSLWDAISFCIFDKCSRTSKASDVLNHSKSEFKSKVNIEINGVDYFIERTGKKMKNGNVKVDVNFYTKVNNNTNSLNGSERRDTNSIIRDYVGTYDDFTLTVMSNQNGGSGFIDKSQKERKELLAQFLDLGIFEKLYESANNEIKELSILLKQYRGKDLIKSLSDAKTDLTSNTDKLNELVRSNEVHIETKIELGNQLSELLSKLIPMDGNLPDLNTLTSKSESISDDIVELNKSYSDYQSQISNLDVSIVSTKSKLDTYNQDELRFKWGEYNRFCELVETTKDEISDIESEIRHKSEHLSGIGSLTFNDSCEHCIENKNTPFAKKAESLQSQIIVLNNSKLDKTDLIKEYSSNRDSNDIRNILREYKELKSNMESLQSQKQKLLLNSKDCELRLSNMESDLRAVRSDIERVNSQKDAITHNNNIQQEIDSVKGKISDIESTIQFTNNKIVDVSGDIKLNNNSIDSINESISKLEALESKYNGYELYLKCVKRDGIPYKLISDALPKIQSIVNNILEPISTFKVLFNTDGKNINSYISYDGTKSWPLELTSGMERFISSVAIRTALTSITNLPKSNFMTIDEGFGTLDSNNFNSLYLLFDYLKSKFDYIVTISHIDKTRDMVDHIIDINKVNGFSTIKYLYP